MMSTAVGRRRPGRRVTALATMAIGTLGLVAGLAPAAMAQDNANGQDSAPSAANRPKRPQLTDEQKACLEAQGLEKPMKPADGTRPPKPTDEQKAKHKAAFEACNIPLPAHPKGPRPNRPKLTDEQKACLEQQGIEKPAKPADGQRVKPTDEQKAKFEAAAKACGIELPARPADGQVPPGRSNASSSSSTTSAN